MISIEKIIDGISEALNTEFGDEYDIYTEDIEQGLNEPCFSIVLLKPSVNQFLGKRYYRTHLFCVHYFPKSTNESKLECFKIEERLMNCLEYITVEGDSIRGKNMFGEISDGVLAFMIEYNMFVNKEQVVESAMETLQQSTDVRKDDE